MYVGDLNWLALRRLYGAVGHLNVITGDLHIKLLAEGDCSVWW